MRPDSDDDRRAAWRSGWTDARDTQGGTWQEAENMRRAMLIRNRNRHFFRSSGGEEHNLLVVRLSERRQRLVLWPALVSD